MWWIIGFAAYLIIGTGLAFSMRDMIGMTLIRSAIIWPVVILFWPIVLVLFMLGNV